jgi:hypothetical protein
MARQRGELHFEFTPARPYLLGNCGIDLVPEVLELGD